MNLQSIRPHQRSQTQNATYYYRISFIRDSGKSKSTGTEITPGDDSAGGMGRAEG